MPVPLTDLTGKKYGAWTVLAKLPRKQYWQCRCDCGTERGVFGADLTRGESTSCGCIKPTPEEIAARSQKAALLCTAS